MLMDQGVLDELNETNQITMFSVKDKREAEKNAAVNTSVESSEKEDKINEVDQISLF